MPGCLQYFCAEWQRARRLVQLDAETLYELPLTIGLEGEVLDGTFLAQHYGLSGWKVDLDDAASVHNMPSPDALQDVNNGSTFNPIRQSSGFSATSEKFGSARSRDHLSPPPTASQPSKRSRAAAERPAMSSPWSSLMSGTLSARTLSRSRSLAAGSSERLGPPPPPVLFVNPSHTLAGLRGDITSEVFVHEVRKRLTAERFFASSSHNKGEREPVFSQEEAEDVFEALLLLQQRPGSQASTELALDRGLDTVVDAFFALSRFRQIMDRSAPSVADFFQRLDLDKNDIVEKSELQHFVKNAEYTSAELPGLTEKLFSTLDANKDGKVELWELRRQIALVAPTRVSATELVGHLEVKYGLGRSGLSYAVDRSMLFERFWRTELLDLSPEDVVYCFRLAGVGKNGMISVFNFDNLVRQLPLSESNWGVEPHYADQAYVAMGMRALVLERSMKQDACLPAEAVLERRDDMLAESELEERFAKLWDRCITSSNSLAHVPASTAQALREGCCKRFKEAARAGWERRKAMELRSRTIGGPFSLFTNIGDVLAVSSNRLYSGQVCVVRYRLLGASNFWHPEHTVLKNEKEAAKWPVKKNILGDTPFIGLVPRGLNSTQAFTNLPPDRESGLRVELPKDRDSGLPLLFGYVELVPPSMERLARAGHGDPSGGEDFELRLFCSTKNKVIGCVGEPVMVTVIRKLLPPPLEALQVRLEGRVATLRWGTLDLGPDAHEGAAEKVRLNMRTDKGERCFEMDTKTTELEVPDLQPDTEFEFRARLENRAGPGREVMVTCRTNAVCSPPGQILVAVPGTTQVDLRFPAPQRIGNEATRDKFQSTKDYIMRYEGTLRVEDEDKGDKGEKGDAFGMGWDDFSPRNSLNVRRCVWNVGQWTEDKSDQVIVRLSSLRPDTRYVLDGLCAVNSMGLGSPTKALVFWTIPQTPKISNVRVRHGMVLVGLSQTGGINVKEYSVTVMGQKDQETKDTYNIPYSQLSTKHDDRAVYPELSLPFEKMPVAQEDDENHLFQVRAKNDGGWSDWSTTNISVAVARQQGAERKLEALKVAIKEKRIEPLSKILNDVRDIELPDEDCRREATALLNVLLDARNELVRAMEVRDPEPLRQALDHARHVELPDLGKAEALLRMLDHRMKSMAEAKGIDPLRIALKQARDAGIPSDLLQPTVERLAAREAAEQNLKEAMKAARCPGLADALTASQGMHLPSELPARELLKDLQMSETLLNAGLKSELIVDLVTALAHAKRSGSRETELIAQCEAVLSRLREKQEAARAHLDKCVLERHPIRLRAALYAARDAQVDQKHLGPAEELLAELEALVQRNLEATGLEQRACAIKAARAARMPQDLMNSPEEQYRRLKNLLEALAQGCVEQLRRTLFKAEQAGLKDVELAEAKVVYTEWAAADHEVDLSATLGQTQRLSNAIEAAAQVGIAPEQLEASKERLADLEQRDDAEQDLREAVQERVFENVQNTFYTACNAEVADMALLETARSLLDRLHGFRVELAAALKTGELVQSFNTLQRTSSNPALPEQELAPLRKLVHDLQTKEHEHLGNELNEASDAGDWRTADAMLHRKDRSKLADVRISDDLLVKTDLVSKSFQDAEVALFEADLQKERSTRAYQSWKDEVPKGGEKCVLPLSSLIGEIVLQYKPGGVKVCILPREIVEFTLVVRVGEELPESCELSPLDAGNARIQHLFRGLRKLLPRDDDIVQLQYPAVIDNEGRVLDRDNMDSIQDGKIDVSVSLYIRAAHSGLEVSEALVDRSDLGHDLWFDDTANSPCSSHASLETLMENVSSSLTKAIAESACAERPADEPEKPRCLADYVRNAHSRVLRRVTLDLTWYYPKGLLDTLDATCFAFSNEKLLEIVDYRGCHGAKYGARACGLHRMMPTGFDNTAGAVRYGGDLLDNKGRRGKQTLHVRLDLLPACINDLVFVMSACGSRDLAKFSNVTVTLYDADAKAVLGSFEAKNTHIQEKEAVIMCSLYRLADGLWRMNSFGATCKGTSRDYRPIITKLQELGFPRNVSMRKQVAPILESIQKQLKVEPATKIVELTISPVSDLTVRYAVELFGPVAQNAERMAKNVGRSGFQRELFKALLAANSTSTDGSGATVGERWTDKNLIVNRVRAKTLNHVEVQLCFGYPEVGKFNHAFHLDGTCMAYEDKGLREVIDYRGPHGVRIVHNGVLDYSGIWVGKVGVADAMGGSVKHVAEVMDDAACRGRVGLQVHLDQLPKAVSDLFFFLSSPVGNDLSTYKDIHIRMVDAENPGHEIFRSPLTPPNNSKAILAGNMSLNRENKEFQWQIEIFGTKAHGNCKDYRPMLLCLGAVQDKKQSTSPRWPFKAEDLKGVELGKGIGEDPSGKGIRNTPRLPDIAGKDYVRRHLAEDEGRKSEVIKGDSASSCHEIPKGRITTPDSNHSSHSSEASRAWSRCSSWTDTLLPALPVMEDYMREKRGSRSSKTSEMPVEYKSAGADPSPTFRQSLLALLPFGRSRSQKSGGSTRSPFGMFGQGDAWRSSKSSNMSGRRASSVSQVGRPGHPSSSRISAAKAS